MVTAHELRTILKILYETDWMQKEPDYDVFVDLLDEINRALEEDLRKRIKTEMATEEA